MLVEFGCGGYRAIEGEDTDVAPATEDVPDDTIVTDGGDPELLNLEKRTSSEISTVFSVTWDTVAASEGWVESGLTTAYGHRTATSPAASTHTLVVVGAPEDLDFHWRAVSRVDGVEVVSADQVHHASAGPPELPRINLDSDGLGAFESSYRLLTVFADVGGVVMYDDNGDAVWWRLLDLGVGTTQTRFAADGSGVYYITEDTTAATDIGAVAYASWDQSVTTSTRAVGGHHDFVILADGRIAYLAVDIRSYDGFDVVGDMIVEMNADGSDAITIWSTWDNVDDPVVDGCDFGFYEDMCDWTHANSLNLDATTGEYLISLHNVSTVVGVDPGDHSEGAGRTMWIAGADSSASAIVTPREAAFVHQHNFKPVGDDQFVVFDNGPGDYSEVWRYQFDREAGMLEERWSFDYGQTHWAYVLGDVHVLANDDYLISWGSEGELTEVTADGDIVWYAYAELGQIFGFVDTQVDVGGPAI